MRYLKSANILLPKKGCDLSKWSVVACDQYTSEPDYWSEVEKTVGNAPSTYNITFPEVYLSEDNLPRIQKINRQMETYMKEDLFTEYKDSFIYLRRRLEDGTVREGLIGKIDLEDYSFTVGTGSLIRATEGTILERIPPRVQIRKDAPLELPHILILIDDPQKTVVEPFGKMELQKVYDFELMQGGGHIEGYVCPEEKAVHLESALGALCEMQTFKEKYRTDSDAPLLMAVGDGNHSLATAKTCWEELKKTLSPEEMASHPGRYALVELENIHSPALIFRPIHRVLFGLEPTDFIDAFIRETKTAHAEGGVPVVFSHQGGSHTVFLPPDELAVAVLQRFCDRYLAAHPEVRVDFVHGDAVVSDLSRKPGNLGILLPAMEKSDLFRGIITGGVLPRKTFSMGEAHEKRFYLEARKIR